MSSMDEVYFSLQKILRKTLGRRVKFFGNLYSHDDTRVLKQNNSYLILSGVLVKVDMKSVGRTGVLTPTVPPTLLLFFSGRNNKHHIRENIA